MAAVLRLSRAVVLGSRVVSCGLGCSVAGGTLVPRLEIKPASSALQDGFFFFLKKIFKLIQFFKLKDNCFTEFCCFLSNLQKGEDICIPMADSC